MVRAANGDVIREEDTPKTMRWRKSCEARGIAIAPKGRSRRSYTGSNGNEESYTADQLEFMLAMDKYKRDNRRFFPTWSEVLEVLLALGYRKGPGG